MKAIMYHAVRTEDVAYPFLRFLHVENFRQQLTFFSDNYNILHPDVLKEGIDTVPMKNSIILTFDDGLKDHYKWVFPELKKRELYGVFYISTGFYQTQKILGVHRLHLLLGKYGGQEIYEYLTSIVNNEMLSKKDIDEYKSSTYKNHDDNDYTIAVKRIMNYFIDYEYREAILDNLMMYFFEDEATLGNSHYLNLDEIKEMNDAGMVIGSHTITHPVMSKLNTAQQRLEIEGSFNFLQSITGPLPYKTFCYPYGGFNSFNHDTERILTDNNCLYSFNVESRDITAEDVLQRPQALPRYDCNEFHYGKASQYLSN